MIVRHDTSQKGFTAMEFMIAITILGSILVLTTNFLFQSFESSNYIRTQNMMKDRMQTALYRIEKSLAQSKRLYGNDINGQRFIAKLPLSAAQKSRIVLPTIRPTGTLVQTKKCDVYPDNYFWPLSIGNSLFFVQLHQSFNDYGFHASSSTISRKINLYRFVAYYVDSSDTNPILDIWNPSASMRAQRLMRWESKLYADYTEFTSYMTYLAGVDPGKQADVVNSLTAQGVIGTWQAEQANPRLAFYDLTGSSTPDQKNQDYILEQFNLTSAILLPSNGSTLYSVAYNKNSDKETADFFPLKTNVPQFYDPAPTPNASACGDQALPASPPTYGGPANAFPGGFEVGITGPNSGRNVYINLTTIGRINAKRIVEKNHVMSAFARDY